LGKKVIEGFELATVTNQAVAQFVAFYALKGKAQLSTANGLNMEGLLLCMPNTFCECQNLT